MTAVIEIDEELKAPPSRRVGVAPWVVAVVALAAGLLGGTVAVVAQSWPEPAAEPVAHEVRFETTGGRVDFAGITQNGRAENVASNTIHRVTGTAAVVLTVRSISEASCRIVVDNVVVDEEFAADGGSATCFALT